MQGLATSTVFVRMAQKPSVRRSKDNALNIQYAASTDAKSAVTGGTHALKRLRAIAISAPVIFSEKEK